MRPEIAADRQHALALDLVHEDRDRHQVGPQRHLVEGEQRPAGEREILLACLAVPAERAVAAAGIDGRATAFRAIGVAVVVRPAEPDEDPLGLRVAHPRDGP